VILGTLSSRPHPEAEEAAIGAALDAGTPLVIVNSVAMPLLPLTLYLVGATGAVLPEEEDLAGVRASAERAAALGVSVNHLRLVARDPVSALASVAKERRAGLLVFGPDPQRIGARRFRRAARKVCKRADCLVLVLPWE
jgi:sugar/nucleoside kinase (ribokinase family)